MAARTAALSFRRASWGTDPSSGLSRNMLFLRTRPSDVMKTLEILACSPPDDRSSNAAIKVIFQPPRLPPSPLVGNCIKAEDWRSALHGTSPRAVRRYVTESEYHVGRWVLCLKFPSVGFIGTCENGDKFCICTFIAPFKTLSH